MRQDLILSRLRQRAAGQDLVRRRARRSAIPELAAQPAAVPLAGSPAPVDQPEAEADPAALMAELAEGISGGG